MAKYTSQLYPNEPIVDDSNYQSVTQVDPTQFGRGLLPRQIPYGALPFAATLTIPLIPRDEWPDRIEEMEKNKTRLSDIIMRANLPCKDQNGTNYCWINAPTHCVEIVRVLQNEPMVILSPASVGAKIKNFANVGGWGTEGLEYIVKHGVVPVSLWPANAISRRYDKPEVWEEAKKYRVVEWWDLKPRNLDELFSVLFARIPVAVGYDWWAHEVTACDPVILPNGTYGVRIRNSWGERWGSNGFGILSGRKALPDDAVAPRVAIPTA